MRGVWTALITPFNEQGGLDLDAFRAILKDQKAARVTGVIPCGTTGESPTLTTDEKKTLIQTAVAELKGSGVKVVAGTGSNDTAETKRFSLWAAGQGVDGVLVVTPYYNKPSQAGLEKHFREVADHAGCEVILYNVPGRTGVSLAPSTVAALASHPRIRSIKEATGNVAFTSELIDALTLAKREMDILSGDDATYLPLLSAGAVGVISVASNLFPRAMVAIQEHMDRGDVRKAREVHQGCYPLFRDLFIDSNPVPVKRAMSYLGWCRPDVRAPLAPLSGAHWEKLEAALKQCGIRPDRREY
jgi:4-hydroxy-tetrahydrodipicolinate synthase